jgi:hypothetical protein
MSFNSDTLENAFYDWIVAITSLTVIWRYANAPRPTLPYIDLNINFIKSIGIDYETTPDSSGNVAAFGNRELTLEINYYGPSSIGVNEQIVSSLRDDNVLSTLNAAGICYVNKMLENNTTVLLSGGSTYEQRSTMELVFRYSNQGITDPSEFNVGLISYVDAIGTVTNEFGQTHTYTEEVKAGTPYTPP